MQSPAKALLWSLISLAFFFPTSTAGAVPVQDADTQSVFLGEDVEVPPQRVSCPSPNLPLKYRTPDFEGQATAIFVVNGRGEVERNSAEIAASHDAMERATRDMVADCVFRPGRVDGQPARIRMEMPVEYSRGFFRFSSRPVQASVPALSVEEKIAARAEVAAWFESELPDFGRFSVRITGDWSESMFRTARRAGEQAARNRTVEIRHRTTDVVMEGCRMAYTSTYQVTGGDPVIRHWIISFLHIDLQSMRIQQLELPWAVRATQSRTEVYMHSLPGQFFVVTDPEERAPRSSLEHRIPIARQADARLVLEKLRIVGELCGGR